MSLGDGMTRFLLTLFHVCLFIGAAVCVIYSLVRWGTEGSTCLPPMVTVKGKGLLVVTNHAFCAGVFGTLGVVSFLNIGMGVLANYFWRRKSVLMFNMLLCILIGIYFTFIAAMLTMYRLVWCDSVQQKMSNSTTCSEAAMLYDKAAEISTLTPYYNRIEIEMVTMLLLLPPSFLCIILYGISMWLPPTEDDRSSYSPIRSTSQSHNPPPETTPLLVNLDDPHGMD